MISYYNDQVTLRAHVSQHLENLGYQDLVIRKPTLAI